MCPRSIEVFFLIFVLPVHSLAQKSVNCTTDGLLFDRYGVEQGLSNPGVLSIAEDQHGYLWIGTDDGLNRFDGQYFTVFRHHPRDGNTLAGNVCWALVPDSGRLWLNTHEGIDRYDFAAGAWQLYERSKGYPGPLAYLFKDSKGRFWACGSFGLVAYCPALDSFDRYTLPDGWPNQKLAARMRWIGEHPDGNLWIGTEAGILIFNPRDRLFTGRLFDPGPGKYRVVNSGTWDAEGGLWFTGWGTGLSYFDAATDENLRTFFPSLNKAVGKIGTGILMPSPLEGTGFVWYLDLQLGLFRFWKKQRRFEPVLTSGELGWPASDQEFRVLFRDRRGILWIGSTKGLLRLDMTQRYLRYVDLAGLKGLPAEWNGIGPIYPDTTDTSGNSWWLNLAYNKGVIHYNTYHRRIRQVPIGQAFGTNRFEGAHSFLLHKGLWIGWANGIQIFDGQTWKFRTLASLGISVQGFPSRLNTFLARDKKNWLWAGEIGRIFWLPPGEHAFRELAFESLLNRLDAAKPLSPRVSEMAEDRLGNRWFALRYAPGCQPALLRFDPESGKTDLFYQKKNNAGDFPTNHDIFTLLADKQGRVWFGTEQGAVWFEPEAPETRFHRFTSADGLPNDMVEFVGQTESGDLLFGTRAGITMANRDLTRIVQLTLPYRVFDGATVPVWQALDLNRFVCSYKKGFFLLDLNRWVWDSVPPAVQVLGIRIDGQAWRPKGSGFPFTGTLRLAYNQTPVEFEFSAIQPHRSELNRIAWRMAGLDGAWHTLENTRSVQFNNLPGGSYTLWVKACNHHGFWSEPLAIQVRVTPPFWETNWFAALCALFLGMLIWGVFQIREKQRRRVERVRQRIARDLHDEMGSTLSGISILSETAAQNLGGADERRLFQTMAGRTREVLDMMSDIVWSINPANDGFDQLAARMRLFAYELCIARDIQLHFKLSGVSGKWRIHPDKRKDFYLLFKEAINNLAKYSGAENAWVSIEKSGRQLTLRIADDGKGFNPGTVKSGNGLKNMRERALKWGGTLQIITSEGAGVTIVVQLPLA